MLENTFYEGSRWGKLTVVSRVQAGFGERGGYLFMCDCGDELVRRPYQIRAMKSPMCVSCSGAAKKGKPNLKNRIDPLERTINEQWNTFNKVARGKSEEFIEKKEWLGLVTSSCVYCGSEPANVKKATVAHALDFKYNGIDRIDSQAGYVSGNCQPCCWVCNRMKGSMTENEFLAHMNRVINLRRK